MESTINSFLFGDDRIATARSGRSTYEHTFGGPQDRKGTSRRDCNGVLIHLLHRFDLTDPAIPLEIPGVRWLPLYYCFDFRVNELGYRLISDNEMKTFFPVDDANVSDEESWPDENYPSEFPKSFIKVENYKYDPRDLDDSYHWAGIFGIRKLSNPDQARVRKFITERCEELGLYAPETDAEFDEALCTPFMQGKPSGPCLNPECSNHQQLSSLKTMALMPAEPVRGVQTFGQYGNDVQLIFQICPNCYTIRVSNQCS